MAIPTEIAETFLTGISSFPYGVTKEMVSSLEVPTTKVPSLRVSLISGSLVSADERENDKKAAKIKAMPEMIFFMGRFVQKSGFEVKK